jgi:hypothetical protein
MKFRPALQAPDSTYDVVVSSLTLHNLITCPHRTDRRALLRWPASYARGPRY